jgi:hypothetical protein
VSEREDEMKSLTPDVEKLFASLAKDADNWSGTPLLGEDGTYETILGYRADRGLLTHLKQAGLVETFETKEDRAPKCTWVRFTDAGREKARELGRRLGWRAAAHFFSMEEIERFKAEEEAK